MPNRELLHRRTELVRIVRTRLGVSVHRSRDALPVQFGHLRRRRTSRVHELSSRWDYTRLRRTSLPGFECPSTSSSSLIACGAGTYSRLGDPYCQGCPSGAIIFGVGVDACTQATTASRRRTSLSPVLLGRTRSQPAATVPRVQPVTRVRAPRLPRASAPSDTGRRTERRPARSVRPGITARRDRHFQLRTATKLPWAVTAILPAR